MIYINEQWRVGGDTYNWTLEKRRKVKDRDEYVWNTMGFYPSLELALVSYSQHKTKQLILSEDKTLKEAIEVLQAVKIEVIAEVKMLKITKETVLTPDVPMVTPDVGTSDTDVPTQGNDEDFDFLD